MSALAAGAFALSALGALKGGGSQSVDTTPKFADEVKPFVTPALNAVASAPDRQVFSGERVAGFNPMQNQGIGMADALSKTQQTSQDATRNTYDQFAGGQFVGSNPYLDQSINAMRQDVQQNLERSVLPSVRNNAIASGALGGSRQGIAEGLALSDANQQMLNAEANMRGAAYNQDMSNMLNAITNQGNILSGQANPMNTLLGTGALTQAQDQAEIDAAMQQFNEQQDLQYNRDLQYLQTLLGSPTGSSSVTSMPQANPFISGLGGYLTYKGLTGGTQAPAVTAPLAGAISVNSPLMTP